MEETKEIRQEQEALDKIINSPAQAPVEDAAPMDLHVTQAYDESQIQVLEGLEAVRKRPGMYIGTTSVAGLHHLVYEIVDNAIDESLAGVCTHIKVSILPGDVIEVVDNGRGIPTEKHHQTGTSTLEVVYTVLHAGGKFGTGGYRGQRPVRLDGGGDPQRPGRPEDPLCQKREGGRSGAAAPYGDHRHHRALPSRP